MLAFVDLSDGGYPIRILSHAGRGSAYIVGDRAELEAALSEMLADVRVAERVKSLAA